MTPNKEISDLDFYVGSFFFGLWALLVATAPTSGTSVGDAAAKVLVGTVLLAVSFFFLRSGLRTRKALKPAVRRVTVISPRRPQRGGNSRAA